MKVTHITDIDKFFEVIDSCKGRVELVTGEGDRLNLKSKLSQYVSMANILYFHFYLSPFFSISFFIIAYLPWIARLFSEFGYCPERFLRGFLSAVFRRHA